MTLPLVELWGEPFEQGLQHGEALREQIAHNLAVYFDRFASEGQLTAEEVRHRATLYVPLLEMSPDYFAAVRGVATASNQELVDVAMLNVRYELLYYQYSVLPVGGPDGCTAFALLPSATRNGHLLIGENWDWIPEVQGAVLRTSETLSFTEAGIVGGKIGLNASGIGLAVNGLLSTEDDWSQMVKPFHVRCYEILRSRTLDEAAGVITGTRRACSTNFVLAQAPDRAVDIEAAPGTSCTLGPERGAVTHTNHFLEPEHLGVEEPHAERRPHSYTRLARMRALLNAGRPLGVEDVQACLRDHDNFPDSVCRHVHPDDPPEEACVTVISAIMDLHERTLWISNGAPCVNAYERYRL
ncbi:MAG TPA: C45 family peptidase [Chloroflexota bacterium]|jgi:isopenicillin-N N-acyltransferase-like protein